jgi:DUF971 family protein
MNAPSHRPTSIVVDREGSRMTIEWVDGHQSVYPLELLRRECPCAGCRDFREKAAQNPLQILSGGVPGADATVRDVRQVGRYAIQITWGDGHDTGIYSYELLRLLSP